MLRAVAETFEDFHYTDEFENSARHTRPGLRGTCGRQGRAGPRPAHAWTTPARITNLTVMVRPMSGLIALAEAMAAKVGHLAK